mmetsp:Transcript_10957/g.27308  ORF Transcript_10957/g.27308 Transcript_10957/m.27308 type:complete len:277 (-) Transcript_10957:26-856(-)
MELTPQSGRYAPANRGVASRQEEARAPFRVPAVPPSTAPQQPSRIVPSIFFEGVCSSEPLLSATISLPALVTATESLPAARSNPALPTAADHYLFERDLVSRPPLRSVAPGLPRDFQQAADGFDARHTVSARRGLRTLKSIDRDRANLTNDVRLATCMWELRSNKYGVQPLRRRGYAKPLSLTPLPGAPPLTAGGARPNTMYRANRHRCECACAGGSSSHGSRWRTRRRRRTRWRRPRRSGACSRDGRVALLPLACGGRVGSCERTFWAANRKVKG